PPRQPLTGPPNPGDLEPSGSPDGDADPRTPYDGDEDPPQDPGGPNGPDGPNDPDDPDSPGSGDEPEPELLNKDLAKAILALSKGKGREQLKKTPFKPCKPDMFDRSSHIKLCTFIQQCQIYFKAHRNDFTRDSDCIFFAISYLREAALGYFESFIDE